MSVNSWKIRVRRGDDVEVCVVVFEMARQTKRYEARRVGKLTKVV
jgi:hypothetical protein